MSDEPVEWGYLCYAGRTRYRYVLTRPGRRGWRMISWNRLLPPDYRYRREHVAVLSEFWWDRA